MSRRPAPGLGQLPESRRDGGDVEVPRRERERERSVGRCGSPAGRAEALAWGREWSGEGYGTCGRVPPCAELRLLPLPRTGLRSEAARPKLSCCFSIKLFP